MLFEFGWVRLGSKIGKQRRSMSEGGTESKTLSNENSERGQVGELWGRSSIQDGLACWPRSSGKLGYVITPSWRNSAGEEALAEKPSSTRQKNIKNEVLRCVVVAHLRMVQHLQKNGCAERADGWTF
jgi:hypothetical protein